MSAGTKHTLENQQVDSQLVDNQQASKRRKKDGVRVVCSMAYFNIDIAIFNAASDLFTDMPQDVIAANKVVCMRDCSPKLIMFDESLHFVYEKLNKYFTNFEYTDFVDLLALPWLKMKLSLPRQFYGEHKTECQDAATLMEAWEWLVDNRDKIPLQEQIVAMTRFVKYLMAQNIFIGNLNLISLCAACVLDDPVLRGGKRRIANVYRHLFYAGSIEEKWYAVISFYQDVKSVAGVDKTINYYKKCIAKLLNGELVCPRPYLAEDLGINQAAAPAAAAPETTVVDGADQVMA